ncbi:hypothetical protein SAMN02745217_01413 [Anaerocolumna xylanovorans DSM 12503]|uniref:Uncharacterized protein n=1 Tax=Anaerocolumna xylanovorans DSM 12503 TaxID=1121345 RepID=A0A1M7Y4L5_9FIRM|nr:hypothetical protein SAMN02745217_01413 [Anaerocolumna xylanovorans DSM 12503]
MAKERKAHRIEITGGMTYLFNDTVKYFRIIIISRLVTGS